MPARQSGRSRRDYRGRRQLLRGTILRPLRHYSATGETFIARHPETVFDFISNPYRGTEVNPTLRLDRLELETEHARWAYYRGHTLGMLPISLALRTDTSQRPWHLVSAGQQNRTPVRFTYRLEPLENGTRLHLTIEVWQKLTFGFLSWVGARLIKMTINRSLKRLKHGVEIG